MAKKTVVGTTLKLTKDFVAGVKPSGERQTFRDTECRGLILRVGASGSKSWAYDYRDAEGKRQTYTFADAERVDPGEAGLVGQLDDEHGRSACTNRAAA